VCVVFVYVAGMEGREMDKLCGQSGENPHEISKS